MSAPWDVQLSNVVLTILAVVIIAIFWWAIVVFFISIFQFIFSKWEAEKIKKAWNNIRYMILWVFFTIILLFIFPFVVKKLQFPWYEHYTPENMFKKVKQLFNIFKEWTSTSSINSWWNEIKPIEQNSIKQYDEL